MIGHKDDRPYWISLATQIELGSKSFLLLESAFSSMEEVWTCSLSQLKQRGLPDKVTKAVLNARRQTDPAQLMRNLSRLDIGVIIKKDRMFPRLLKELPDCPAVLFCRGDISGLDQPGLAVVGSRKASPYGQLAAKRIVPSLVQSGLTIISGLALGIDALSHRLTLEAGGRAVAVLGSGLDRLTPSQNAPLAGKIIDSGGLLLSEYPLGTPSYPSHFPIRNRIIAGLSLGTLVIEAAVDSGSLLTARAALEYNREVFAVPGDIFRETAQGSNNLIKMGGKMVTSAEDILLELSLPQRKKAAAARQLVPDTPAEAILLPLLSEVPLHVDALAKSSKISIEQVGAALVLLEMKGKVRNVGGNQYVKFNL